jgi:eukaryotic-like serine/threonine-protein kinase
MAEGVGPGTIIDGRYKVLSRLGSGGMADVFLAEDEQLGRKVALKLLHRRFAQDPDFVERFRREAQAAAGLQHPNVVGVYDRGSFDDTYYIAMEYLPGRSLKQLIRQEAPLDPVRAIDITIQLLKAARFAHRRGVIHRDLKPHNVIVDDSDHAKVTDFGIARAGASDMTETGSIMGTAQYLSPEQAQGHAVSASSDLYSIGVVLYELLTARVPFDADSAVTIALKHVSQAPTAPTQINAQVPPELEQVVMWVLNKDPAHRPQDADQFITALEQAKAAILAGQRGQRTASMAALAGVGAYAATAATAPAAAAAAPELVHEAGNGVGVLDEEPPPPEEHERRAWPWLVLLLVLLLLAGGAAAYLLTRPKTVAVPVVTGEQLSLASTQLQNAGFGISTVNEASNHPSGFVIRQDPVGGTKAKQGSTVTLFVSSGPGNATVPSVVDLPLNQAKQMIQQARLRVGRVQYQSSTSVPKNDVISTDPTSGQTPPVGTAVTLFVSSGPPPPTLVQVPDVTGQTEAAAKSQLQAAGFHVTTTNQTTSSTTAGSVVSQNPAGGKQAAQGSTVTLVIAQAPTTAKVPNVVGQTASAAAAALTGAGFTVNQQTKATTKKKENGVVLSETPAGNSTANKGSAVTIVVGQYTAPTHTTTTPTTPTKSHTTPTTPTTPTTSSG